MREVYQGEAPSESSTAPRVSQLDSDELDEALVSMLGERVSRSLDNFRSSMSWDLKPELELVIKLVVFRFGVWDPLSRSSPGAKLQNLKLVLDPRSRLKSTRNALLLYLILHPPLFLSYILKRIRQHALSQQWPDLPQHDWRLKCWKAIGRVESVANMWAAVSWAMFLWDGKYPSLLLRLLGLRLTPSQPHLSKLVSYEFMNRQLVWNAFTEFLMFAVPLMPPMVSSSAVSPQEWLKPIRGLFSQRTDIDYQSLPIIPPAELAAEKRNEVKVHKGPLAHLPKTTCPICYLRHTSAPVPLSSSSQGTSISLPPLPTGAADSAAATEDNEDRIFVPARTDCEGECVWCYYCIGEELYRNQEEVALKPVSKNGPEESDTEEGKWSCLRCGGKVGRAWRVGVDEDD
ncbi:hypothetical protein L202_03711 [Cryptococcus amylolentus CBS 6039]|uniref:Pex N-terminal domain-containing protein n=2 Tax=Cryptococcus amylolentus TaxID=104669 RepID=A0A1E3HTZ4_9TREE|nr:hypothetical protein L202_03711 [Cryptococcus amylolentus CBS 6039]ODN79814.1 hypothetical protein L202_03711 [Cryptococcus amylolentus CBS 6039]ODO08087.1 hypothetical protein I350_03670 [Cryptococcus amylolentus CBS 6273]